ncbi:MAG TPA: hypothetical protein VL359_03320, partial [bacterium]|nr:hypothetical protein [bacterium]
MAEAAPEQREQAILEEIIHYYLQHHEAISARTLAKISRLALSPTSIRNLMEDLSAAGLLTSQGVPRGRVPTQKAFSIYVTRLRAPPAREEAPLPGLETGVALTLAEALERVATRLAGQTGCVALAALPHPDLYPLDWVQLSAAPADQVLVVLRTRFGDLWSKLIPTPAPFPDALLGEVAHTLTRAYRGQALGRIREDIMRGEPKELLERMPSMGAAFRMLRRAFEWDAPQRPLLWGEENLVPLLAEAGPEEHLRLHRALHDPALLTQSLAGGLAVHGARVSIGTGTGYRGLEECAVVGQPFGTPSWEGWLG